MILKELREGNQARESGKLEKAAGEIKKKLEEERRKSQAKAKRITELKELCRVNMERAEKTRSILERQRGISEGIKQKLYPEFDRQKRLISGDQEKIEKYNSDIADLKITTKLGEFLPVVLTEIEKRIDHINSI